MACGMAEGRGSDEGFCFARGGGAAPCRQDGGGLYGWTSCIITLSHSNVTGNNASGVRRPAPTPRSIILCCCRCGPWRLERKRGHGVTSLLCCAAAVLPLVGRMVVVCAGFGGASSTCRTAAWPATTLYKGCAARHPPPLDPLPVAVVHGLRERRWGRGSDEAFCFVRRRCCPLSAVWWWSVRVGQHRHFVAQQRDQQHR